MEARRLYRKASSAKKGLAGFLAGGAATLGGGFWLAATEPLLLLGPGAVALLCAALGAGWYWRSPRTLVGRLDRDRLDHEVEILERQALPPIDPLPLPEHPCDGAQTLTGEVVAPTVPDPLFAPGPAVAERVVGEATGGPIDDARVSAFDLRVGPDDVVRIEPDGWVVDIPCDADVDLEPAPGSAQGEYLDARGARTARASVRLRTGHVAPGHRVTVEGLVEDRAVPGGYRGSKVVRRVGGPWALLRRV